MSSSSMAPASASPPLQRAPPPPVAISHHLHHHILNSQQRSHPQSPTTTITSTATPLPSSEDDLLAQLSREELISRIRSLEAKNRKLLYDNGSMMKDINHHLSTIQQLKQTNYQLVTNNGELREMCCHLDDERSRSKAIAKEWQSFGTHMSRVMRHEVTNYSNKLSQLEAKQFELVRENFELKQLCLLLDNAIATRESGDGSTSSTAHLDTALRTEGVGSSFTNSTTSSSMATATTTTTVVSNGQSNSMLSNGNPRHQQQQHRVVLSQQILEYIRNLESKIQQLEWEKKQLCDLHSNPDTIDSFENNSVTHSDQNNQQCPTAIAEAMRVLRIHESLDAAGQVRSSGNGASATAASDGTSSNGTGNMNGVGEVGVDGGGVAELDEATVEQQKAIVRSLCNVAWRKIEDGGS